MINQHMSFKFNNKEGPSRSVPLDRLALDWRKVHDHLGVLLRAAEHGAKVGRCLVLPC